MSDSFKEEGLGAFDDAEPEQLLQPREETVSPANDPSEWLMSLKEELLKISDHDSPSEEPDLEQVVYILASDDKNKLLLEKVLIVPAFTDHIWRVQSYDEVYDCGNPGANWQKAKETNLSRLARHPAACMDQADITIANLFASGAKNASRTDHREFPCAAELTRTLLEQILTTGRCFWTIESTAPLRSAARQKAEFKWRLNEDGSQTLSVIPSEIEGGIAVCGGNTSWFVDPTQNQMGELSLPIPAQALLTLLDSSAVQPLDVESFTKSLANLGLPIPPPHQFETTTFEIVPVPRLRKMTIDLQFADHRQFMKHGYNWNSHVAVAELSFEYSDYVFTSKQIEIRRFVNNVIEIYQRDLLFEKACRIRLQKAGLIVGEAQQNMIAFFPSTQNGKWHQFSDQILPLLEQDGWLISEDSFPARVVYPEEEWDLHATNGKSYWFSVRLDITVDGIKYPLLPIIYKALSVVDTKDALAHIDAFNIGGLFYAPLPDERTVALDFERVKQIVEILVEVFNRDYTLTKPEKADLNMAQLLQLAKAARGITWHVSEKLQELLDKFRNPNRSTIMAPPTSFQAQLRPYQCEGLAWLDLIRDLGLGGILADDMGLGKTVQTLAHFAIEKEEKRATKPFLVICPTSVLPNWVSEIKRFTPTMKLTVLWGADRRVYFNEIETADIVLTTYPLIFRDRVVLARQEWQAIFLDEAQMVKNSHTLAAQSLRTLKANYRVCLTGTPVQNHLGELWSQFDFLIPGFLGDEPSFKKTFRWLIERYNNQDRQHALAERIKPFVLRRTKELVAKELPDKNVIVRKIELEGAQRDLYETMRVAMQEKVQTALALKGIAASQIIILDALLKLRQVCCHPQLVPFATARSVKESSKLEHLLETLEELISEGKRVLLFSQFTSMLDLIKPRLKSMGINFVELRGDTKDRKTPVREFQDGEVPLFLLSLRAGGLGLNLTAADTVIHYDPWWNPAVENQATDRAHRIGQTKKVFVFRMIATGTIEERMLKLQERKQKIAAGIYTDQADNFISSLSKDEIISLFEPMPILPKPVKDTGKRPWWGDGYFDP